MSATEILSEIHRRGIHLEAQNGQLRYRARKGALTPELRQAIAHHKADLISILARTHGQASPTGHGLCPGPQKCAGCYAIPGGRFIHPPRVSEEWKAWLNQWHPGRGERTQ